MYYLYTIENYVNNKIYIGITKNIKHRWMQHKYNAKTNLSYHLYRAMRKHGIENFYIKEFIITSSKEEACLLEEYWINYLKSNNILLYNMVDGGQGYNVGHKMSDSTIEKITHRMRTNNPMTGKIQSEQTKNLISLRNKGKLSGTNNPKSKLTYEVVNNIRELYKFGNYSHKELSKLYNVGTTTIQYILTYKTWK